MMLNLKVYSVFESISGEAGGFPQGSWCTFIRLFGCNLECYWCDTPESRQGTNYKEYTPSELLSQCRTKRVLITGGEPLVQREGLIELINLLLDHGHSVQVETNGSYAIPTFPYILSSYNLSWVVDYKCLSSLMTHKMRELDFLADNIHEVRQAGNTVHLKWVVAGKMDVVFAIARIMELRQIIGHPYLGPHIISPTNADGTWIDEIVQEIKKAFPILLDNIIFSVQLHKIVKMP